MSPHGHFTEPFQDRSTPLRYAPKTLNFNPSLAKIKGSSDNIKQRVNDNEQLRYTIVKEPLKVSVVAA